LNIDVNPKRDIYAALGSFGARTLQRQYDLFEILPDGAPIWRGVAHGHENAIRQLQELAETTTNEVRVMHIASNAIIATMNNPKPQGTPALEGENNAE
jgi:hypothetical protein